MVNHRPMPSEVVSDKQAGPCLHRGLACIRFSRVRCMVNITLSQYCLETAIPLLCSLMCCLIWKWFICSEPSPRNDRSCWVYTMLGIVANLFAEVSRTSCNTLKVPSVWGAYITCSSPFCRKPEASVCWPYRGLHAGSAAALAVDCRMHMQ
jgi:hypothetical protein